MKRTVEKIEVITYTVSGEEIVDAVMRNAKTDDGKTLIVEGCEVIGVPDKIEFVYRYPIKEANDE